MPEEPRPESIVTRSPLTRGELRELIAEEVRVQVGRIAHGYMEGIAELREELEAELEALNRRVSDVHERALRALTKQIDRKGK